MTYIFFDQNVMERLSKKRHESFQNNTNKVLLERTRKAEQLLTPFSILEFSGYTLANINIKYKNQILSSSEGHHRQIDTGLDGNGAPQRQWPALPKVATDVPHQKAIRKPTL